MSVEQDIQIALDRLSNEKLYLGSIRSLKEDDRFIRYVVGLRARFDATNESIDALPADDTIGIATLKGQRSVYKHELRIIDNASERIKVIDEELILINKERKIKTKGTEGRSKIVSPKENK